MYIYIEVPSRSQDPSLSLLHESQSPATVGDIRDLLRSAQICSDLLRAVQVDYELLLLRNWSLIMGRGGATNRKGGHVKFYL